MKIVLKALQAVCSSLMARSAFLGLAAICFQIGLLPAGAFGEDTLSPTVTAFTMPATSTLLTVPVTTFSASDDTGVTGYLITESDTAPLADDPGWSGTPPADFTFAGYGSRTAYAWARDAAGNVSASLSAGVTIRLGQTITFDPLPTKTYGDADVAPGATASSGLTVTYGSSDPAVATIVDGQIHVVGAGTTDITASQAGDATYEAAADVIRTLTVNKAAQSITFAAPTIGKTYGAADFSAMATTSSPLAVTYDSSDAAVATVNVTTGLVHIVGAGSVTITANLAGDANYEPASAQTQLTVDKAVLTVTPQNTSRPYGTDNPAFTPIYSGFVNGETGSVLTGAPELTTLATISSPVGSYEISAAIGTLAAANYSFSFATGTLAVDLASQSITFNPLAAKTYGDVPFDLSATGGASGNPVTFASSDPAVASISGTTVTIVGAGSATITASQAGDANYASATAQQTLTINKAVLTVTPRNASRPYGTDNPAFSVIYSGFVNGETEAVLTGAPELATTAIIASPAGSYPITAAIGTLAAANYSFSLATGTLAVDLATQTITFDPPAAKTYGDAAFDLSASGGGSGNPVTFSSADPAVATISGATVTIVGAGSTVITASQAGDANYASATAQQTLTVAKAVLGVTADNQGRIYGSANPTLTASYSGFVNGDTAASLSGAADVTTTATAASPVGTYPITAAPGNLFSTNYTFSYAPGTLTVNPAPLTVTADNKSKTFGAANPVLTVSYSGFANGESAADLAAEPVPTTTATTDSPAGSYPITVSGGSGSNYSFTYVPGTLTVNPPSITVTAFTMPATSSTLTVPVTLFTATDAVGVAGYMITESAAAPPAADLRWTATPPASFTFAGWGARTAYAWAKDGAGNVSSSLSAAVTINDIDPPTVTTFDLPVSSTALEVAVTAFTAGDNVGVTGYLITESATVPAAGDSRWLPAAPASFIFSAPGPRTAYAWAKDAAGNVSAFAADSVTINLPASHLEVTGAATPVTAGIAGSITVTAKDSFGNTVIGYTGVVRFTSTDPQAGLPADYTFVPGDAGLHVFTGGIALKTSGTHTITVTDTGSPAVTGSQSGIVVNPAQAVTLAATGIPSPVTAGAAATITVTAKDAFGNTATGYTGLVHFTGSDARGVLPADYRFVSGDAGVRTLVSQVIFRTAGTHWITVTDSADPLINGTQSGIAVTPADATALIVAGIAAPRTAGTPATMTVTARDAFGNVATGFTGTLRFGSTDPRAVLPADYTFAPADAGNRSFTLELRTAGAHSVSATEVVNGLVTGMQSGITVVAASADSLAVTGLATPRQANSAGSLTVTARDAYGNTADGYRGVVHFTSTDTAAVLPADYAFAAGDGGSHTFLFETTLKTVGTHSITATDVATPSLSGTQSGISVIPAQQAAQSAKVAAGATHTVVVDTEGRVFAWGKNDMGQLGIGSTEGKAVPVEVTGVTGVRAIAAGNGHTVALKNDGTVWAWGGNAYGQLGDNTVTNRLAPVQVQGLSDVTAIAAGAYHTLALKSDGTVWSWGDNGFGQLGDGSTINRAVPVPAQVGAQISMIAAGGYHSLFVTRAAKVHACGANASGQLGNGSTGSSSIAYEISGLADVKAVAAGLQHSLALKENGTVWSWGDNAHGQLGDGSTGNALRPVQVASIAGATGVAGGDTSSIAVIKDGTVRAWGGNSSGQLGDGTTAESLVPVQVRDLTHVTAIASGASHAVALATNGTIWTWGNNGNGQLGSGDTGFKTGLVAVTGLAGVSTATGGAGHMAALKSDGTVWTWGKNNFGQLGDGTLVGRAIPAQVASLSGVTAVAAGANHTAALKSDGTVWTWGANVFGQLGDGTTTDRNAPVQVQGLSGITAIAAGEFFTLALGSDGIVRGWGANTSGQLGDGTTTNRLEPVMVADLSNVSAIAAGYMHSMALKSDGTVWTWGYNSSGQLGDGTTTFRKLPVQAGVSDIGAIAAGSNHCLALDGAGAVWAWGNNAYGQLGDGTLVSRSLPVQPVASGASAVAAGANHSAALLADRTVSAWGANYFGQLGDGTATGRLAPLTVEGSASTVAVLAGDSNTLLVKSDGSLWNTGNNDSGQIGDGSPYTPSVVPAIILGTDTTPPVTTASLEEGSYTSDQVVSLIADEPATIYFTVDGLVPTTASPVYSSPIPVTASMVLRFFAIDLNGNTEAVQTRSYTRITSFSLAVGVAGTGSGRVDMSIGGSCSGNCAQNVPVGVTVVLSPVASQGSFFAGWTGCDSVSGDRCTVTMTNEKNVTATFSPIHALSVGLWGTGTVHFSTGETCAGSCVQNYRSGTTVVMTATPDASTIFDAWYGCDSATSTTCSVAMTGARSVTAMFGARVSIGQTAYPSIQYAYADLRSIGGIILRAGDFNETLYFNRDVTATILGGYRYDTSDGESYYARGGQTVIHGTLFISGGTVVLDSIIIQ